MNQDVFSSHMRNMVEALFAVREDGQKEYARGEDAFGNFNREAAKLNIPRGKVLMIYFDKHLDGILSYLDGHKSQRESVHGRIKDAIMYLMLLDGMITEDEWMEQNGEQETNATILRERIQSQLLRALVNVRDTMKTIPAMQGREFMDLGISVNNAIAEAESFGIRK